MDSIECFYPDMDCVVYDDASTEPQLLAYYEELRAKGISVIVSDSSGETNRHGNLYSAMNSALQRGIELEYRYVFFVQDDTQFLWRNASLLSECDTAFSDPNVLMYSPVFLQKIYRPVLAERLEIEQGKAYFIGMGVADVGILSTQRAQQAALQFSSKGEAYNGATYRQKGYRLQIAKNPCICWVPWEDFFRGKQGNLRLPLHSRDRLFVKEIAQEKAEAMRLTDEAFQYLEDNTSLQNPWIPKPYVHGATLRMSLGLYWRYIFRRT